MRFDLVRAARTRRYVLATDTESTKREEDQTSTQRGLRLLKERESPH